MEHTVNAQVDVLVTIAEDCDAISRILGATGDEWRSHFYSDVTDESSVLNHFVYNAVANGVTDASRLDGWADLTPGQATMRVIDVYPS